MKLSAFRIRNFRSIVDTGWTKLAPDNITTLIGQNESGKTSVLEGIHSFYTSRIDEDILRSDLSLPHVSCEFILSEEELKVILSNSGLPQRVSKNIQSNGKLHLNRKWVSKNESLLYYGDDVLLSIYQKEEKDAKVLDQELSALAENLLTEKKELDEIVKSQESDHARLSSDLSAVNHRIGKLERLITKTRNDKKIESAQHELTDIQLQEGHLKIQLNKLEDSLEEDRDRQQILLKKFDYARKYLSGRELLKENHSKIPVYKNKIEEIREKLDTTKDEKQSVLLISEMESYSNDLEGLQSSIKTMEHAQRFACECFELALKNAHSPEEIESLAWERMKSGPEDISLEQAGNMLFDYLTDFKLFEDFSSLLPNKIDLDDILSLNENVEGFNAARNFLIVSGLDYSFFKESNNRILKQKIEKLNGEITLHIQGYWRQNLGKNNKIRLNFELEHYDLSHPDKKGKPYLEFWIKDENERLYPKQRSRGVRWFLSFYLELKATSLSDNKKGKILLIDEPGLSLHARAQEDVLEVFEDLKEDIQIIYSTHSPHLVNTDKLYRLLAVQRDDEYDDRSATRIFDIHSLSDVSGDTLSPIYTLLGTQISESNFIRERNNVILEDSVSFYYISTLFEIFEPEKDLYFLPSTDIHKVSLLLNLLTGWKLKFGVLLSDNPETEKVLEEIKEKIYFNKEQEMNKNISVLRGFSCMENLFSTIDFKKFILRKRIGITESNLEHIENNNLNRLSLATSFALYCRDQKIASSDFDEETRDHVTSMIRDVLKIVKQ